MLLLLDDNTLGLILQHCRKHDTPATLAASVCRRLSDVARSHTLYSIRLDNTQLAQLPAMSASTTVPFSGCTSLEFNLTHPITALLDGQAVAAALAAPGRWPGLKRLHIETGYLSCNQEGQQADQYAGRLISSLGSLKGLRELSIMAPLGPCCQAGLAAANDVTRLELGQKAALYMPFDLSALASLNNLRHLILGWDVTPRPPSPGSNRSSRSANSSSSSSSRSCLPSSLVALDCSLNGLEAVHWLHHLAGCPGLRQLRVTYAYDYWDMALAELMDSVPPSVLDLAAKQATGLTSLWVEYNVQGAGMPQPSPDQLHINSSLTRLTQLQQMRLCRDVQLQISTDQEWRHLGCLASLQCLVGGNIRLVPPAGVQLRQLKELSCSVTLSMADIGLLLAACPALMDVTLEVTPQQAPGTSSSSSHTAVASSSSAAPAAASAAAAAATVTRPSSSSSGSRGISIHMSYGGNVTAEAAAAHFAAGAPALARLRHLSLTWPQSSTTSAHLPDLGALTALTSLSFSSQGQAGCVKEEDLVLALQPVSRTLRELRLRRLPLVTPRTVVMLQGVLPFLQGCVFEACGCLTRPTAALKRSSCSC